MENSASLSNKEHEEKLPDNKKQKRKEKKTLVALPQVSPKKIQIRIFGGLIKLFFFNGVLAADHSENQKDLLMNLHYSHTKGRFEPL